MPSDLYVTQTPDAVVQQPIFGDTISLPPPGVVPQYPVGSFAFNAVPSPGAIGPPSWFNATPGGGQPNLYTLPLNVVREVTIQIFPLFNPFLVVSFSNGQNPTLDNGIKFMAFSGYDLTVGGPVNNIDAGLKLSTGFNTFGPFKLPGDFIYFRAYQLNIQFTLPSANQQPGVSITTTPSVKNWTTTVALLTAVGN